MCLCKNVLFTYLFSMLGVEMPSHMIILCLNLLRNCQTLFPSWINHFPFLQQCMRSTISPHPHSHLLLSFLNYYYRHLCEYQVVPNYGFDFPNDSWYWTFFHELVGPLYIFYEEIFKSFVQLKKLSGLPFCCWVLNFIYIYVFWFPDPYEIYNLQILSPNLYGFMNL